MPRHARYSSYKSSLNALSSATTCNLLTHFFFSLDLLPFLFHNDVRTQSTVIRYFISRTRARDGGAKLASRLLFNIFCQNPRLIPRQNLAIIWTCLMPSWQMHNFYALYPSNPCHVPGARGRRGFTMTGAKSWVLNVLIDGFSIYLLRVFLLIYLKIWKIYIYDI